MCWKAAFSRAPNFQTTEEREALETKNLSRLQELATTQHNLERDINTSTAEWDTTKVVVRNNNNEAKDRRSIIKKYAALIANPTDKTIADYKEHSEGIQYHSIILARYKLRYVTNTQASNSVYARQVQQEIVLATSKEATALPNRNIKTVSRQFEHRKERIEEL